MQDRLIARLVDEFDLSVAERLRLGEVRAALARHGVEPTDRGFARWLSPVFCTSSAEQAQFLARFEELRAEEAAAARPARFGRERDRATVRFEPDPTDVPAADMSGRPQVRRSTLGPVLLGLALLIVSCLILLRVGTDIVTNQSDPAALLPDLPAPSDTLTRYQRIAAGWGLKLDLGVWALLGLVPLGLGLALGAYLVIRLLRERRAFRPLPELSRPVALQAALGQYFAGPDVLRSLLNLGRHRQSTSSRLHLRRSLRATVRNAGYPTLRFGARPTIPGYLLLIDRESPRDHLPLLGDMLARRLRQQHAAVTRYGFHRRPALLGNLDEPTEPPATLDELVAILPDARVLILAEADCLVQTSGDLADWLAAIAVAGHVTVLDPRAEPDWAGDEAALRRGGLAVLPATPDGVRRYADWIATGGGAPASVPHLAPGLDVPFQLSRHRARLLSEEPMPDDLIAGLLRDLLGWLDEDLMRLLRALAVFSRLEPPLTLALGKALVAADGQPVLSDESLLRIVRLPWLRAGRMPDQLRRHLVRDLSANDLRTTVTIVHAFLVADLSVLRDGAARAPRRADLLAHWLREAEDSDLHDPLLIDAVEGRAADRLGTPPDRARVPFVRAFGKPALVTAAVSAVAASVVMWLQPLYRDQPLPTNPTPPASASPTPQPSPEPFTAFTSPASLSSSAVSAVPTTADQVVGGSTADGWDVDVFWCAGDDEAKSYAAASQAATTIVGLSTARQALAPGVRLGRVRLRVLSLANQKSGLFYRGPSNYVVEDGAAGEVEAAVALATALSHDDVRYTVKTNIRTKTRWYLSVFACGTTASAPR